jgi:hypothetical protein
MPTPIQISLVQGSFAQLTPIADAAAAMFYRRLFELDPSLSRLFKGDMQQQGKKLMQMIGAAVRGLDDLAKLVPRWCSNSAFDTTAMACAPSTTPRSAPRCCGRWNRALAPPSHPLFDPPGLLSTACSLTPCRPPHATRHGPQAPAWPAGHRNRPLYQPPHRIPGALS